MSLRSPQPVLEERHAIGSFVADVVVAQRDGPLGAPDRLARQIRTELLPALEQVFSDAEVQHADAVINALEINLGDWPDDPDWPRLRLHFREQLLAALRPYLRTRVPAEQQTTQNPPMVGTAALPDAPTIGGDAQTSSRVNDNGRMVGSQPGNERAARQALADHLQSTSGSDALVLLQKFAKAHPVAFADLLQGLPDPNHRERLTLIAQKVPATEWELSEFRAALVSVFRGAGHSVPAAERTATQMTARLVLAPEGAPLLKTSHAKQDAEASQLGALRRSDTYGQRSGAQAELSDGRMPMSRSRRTPEAPMFLDDREADAQGNAHSPPKGVQQTATSPAPDTENAPSHSKTEPRFDGSSQPAGGLSAEGQRETRTGPLASIGAQKSEHGQPTEKEISTRLAVATPDDLRALWAQNAVAVQQGLRASPRDALIALVLRLVPGAQPEFRHSILQLKEQARSPKTALLYLIQAVAEDRPLDLEAAADITDADFAQILVKRAKASQTVAESGPSNAGRVIEHATSPKTSENTREPSSHEPGAQQRRQQNGYDTPPRFDTLQPPAAPGQQRSDRAKTSPQQKDAQRYGPGDQQTWSRILAALTSTSLQSEEAAAGQTDWNPPEAPIFRHHANRNANSEAAADALSVEQIVASHLGSKGYRAETLDNDHKESAIRKSDAPAATSETYSAENTVGVYPSNKDQEAETRDDGRPRSNSGMTEASDKATQKLLSDRVNNLPAEPTDPDQEPDASLGQATGRADTPDGEASAMDTNEGLDGLGTPAGIKAVEVDQEPAVRHLGNAPDPYSKTSENADPHVGSLSKAASKTRTDAPAAQPADRTPSPEAPAAIADPASLATSADGATSDPKTGVVPAKSFPFPRQTPPVASEPARDTTPSEPAFDTGANHAKTRGAPAATDAVLRSGTEQSSTAGASTAQDTEASKPPRSDSSSGGGVESGEDRFGEPASGKEPGSLNSRPVSEVVEPAHATPTGDTIAPAPPDATKIPRDNRAAAQIRMDGRSAGSPSEAGAPASARSDFTGKTAAPASNSLKDIAQSADAASDERSAILALTDAAFGAQSQEVRATFDLIWRALSEQVKEDIQKRLAEGNSQQGRDPAVGHTPARLLLELIARLGPTQTNFRGLIQHILDILTPEEIDQRALLRQLVARLGFVTGPRSPALHRQILDGLDHHLDQGAPASANVEQTAPMGQSSAQLVTRHAGLVLFHPYYKLLFSRMGLLAKDNKIPPEQRGRGRAVLEVLAGAQAETQLMDPMARLLLGLTDDIAPPPVTTLSGEEADLIDGLMRSVIAQWSKLGQTSPDGLRDAFIRRGGHIRIDDAGAHLRVDPGPFDVLLDGLPWALDTIVALPWMPVPCHVTWRATDG